MRPNTVKTWNGHSINDGTYYRAYIQNAGVLPEAKNVWLPQAQSDSLDSGAFTVGLRTPLVYIEILDYTNRDELGEQLKSWFKRGTRGYLVTTFKDDGEDYQLSCACINIVQPTDYPTVYVAQLESGDTHWRAVDPDTASWQITGTGGTKKITVEGGDETTLNAAITATANPTVGYLYQQVYQFVPVAKVNFGLRPWCVQLDTAALVTAGKMQADCDDLRVVVNGKETNRWLADENTDHTKIWFNLKILGYAVTLGTAIASTGTINVIQLAVTTANKATLSKMPASGIVYHGSEWFYYKGRNINKCQLLSPKRALYGTSMQAHVSGDAFTLIPYTIVLKYGNSAVGDPADDDADYNNEKPVFDLSASDNTKWVYTASTKFYDPDRPAAPGSWSPILETLDFHIEKVSKYYWIKEDAETGDAAMGGKLGTFLKRGVWQAETGKAGWLLKCAGGFYKITLTGRKYRSTVRWPTFAGCQRSTDNITWYTLWTDATPASASSWASLASHSSVSIASGTKYLFFGLSGQIKVLANAYAMLEGLTATVEFTSANLPTGTLLGEKANFTLKFTLSNDETDDSVEFDYPMLLNTVFNMDGEAHEATFDDAYMHSAMQLDDESRSTWIRLVLGDNIIRAVGVDCGTTDIVLSWYRRRL